MSRLVEPTGAIVELRSDPSMNSIVQQRWDEIGYLLPGLFICEKREFLFFKSFAHKLDVLSRRSHRTTPHEAVSQLRRSSIINVI
jgi:hypothetical protein